MSSKNYYVNGNTVRELDTPVRHNQRTRKEIEEARRRKNRRNAARRNRQRAMEMSRGYVVFLTACVVITALTAVLFVQMQSQMTTRMKNVANLESQLADLRTDHNADCEKYHIPAAHLHRSLAIPSRCISTVFAASCLFNFFACLSVWKMEWKAGKRYEQ